ncbi:hypothetical protein GF342_02590 [Candidatus Woesearchaeota archaeon]|nr:hypothetical protein [Candidatus Woesearchaeota archaeon]
MRRLFNYSLLTVLFLPAAYASNPAVDRVLTFIRDIFTSIFNPSAEGLGIFLKFLIIVTTFGIVYELLPSDWKKGVRGVIAGGLALGAGLAIPTSLALTSGTLLGAIVVAVIFLIPFALLSLATYHGMNYVDTNWKYPAFALMWLVYFTILVYFLAHWGQLLQAFAWVFFVVLILAIISPIIVLVLIGVAILGGETREGTSWKNLMKNISRNDVKNKATDANKHLGRAQALLRAVPKTKSVEAKHAKIREALSALRASKNSVNLIAAQAAKLLADKEIADTTKKDAVRDAQDLVGELNALMFDLHPLLDEEKGDTIDTYLKDNDYHEKDKSKNPIAFFMDRISIVSQITRQGD